MTNTDFYSMAVECAYLVTFRDVPNDVMESAFTALSQSLLQSNTVLTLYEFLTFSVFCWYGLKTLSVVKY